MKGEYPNMFISTELTYKSKKAALPNLVGIAGKGVITANAGFFKQLREGMERGEPKLVVELAMYTPTSGHSNSLLIDSRDRTISVFEPNGALSTKFQDPSTILAKFVKKYLKDRRYGDYVVRPANLVCPQIGVQALEHRAYKARKADKRVEGHGFCTIWSLMYIHYHLLNPNDTHENVLEKLMKTYTPEELELRVMRYVDKILRYIAGVDSPKEQSRRKRCMRFLKYYDVNEDNVLGLKDPITNQELIDRKNRQKVAEECRKLLLDQPVAEEGEDDNGEEEVVSKMIGEREELLRSREFQFDEPKVAQCLRVNSNVREFNSKYKFDNNGFDKDYVKSTLTINSPKTVALITKIRELDQMDMETHGKKFKHFIFSDIRQEGAKFLIGALLANGFDSCFRNNSLSLGSRQQMLTTSGNNVIFLLSSTVFGKTFTVELKKEVLSTFNSRPDNVNGELARIIVLDSGYKEGIDLFDVKYVHIFEPPTTRANLRQTIGRATRFCGQAGLPFVQNEGWLLSVYLYDVAFEKGVIDSFKIQQGSDIMKRYLLSDHRLTEFEEELENFCLEVSVDRDLNRQIHQLSITVEAEPSEVEINNINPQIQVQEMEQGVNLVPVLSPVKISCKSKCGILKPTKGVPISTSLFYIIAYCLGYKKEGERPNSLDHRQIREYCCSLLSERVFCNSINKAINESLDLIVNNRDILIRAFDRGGDFRNLRTSLRNQMQKIVYLVLERNEVDEITNIQRKYATRKLKNKFVIPQVQNLENPQSDPVPPSTRLTHENLTEYILENYSHCIWPKPKMENLCVTSSVAQERNQPKVVSFTPTQEFIRTYFTPRNPYKGMLIQHGVGCGKTCTAIATATSTFDREGYKILWVTRTSLKSDIYKNMFELVCNTHIRERLESGERIPEDTTQRMKLLGKAWSIPPISYRQFSNLVEGKNELYTKLVNMNGQEDPLKKTLIIIDEAHKLYGGDDLSGGESPNIEAIHEALMNSYSKSGDQSARVLMMTATPYTTDPMQFFKLINLVREPNQQLPTDFDEMRAIYLDSEGKFTQEGRKQLMDQLAGQISYLNRQTDLRQFAQVRMHHLLINERVLTNPEIYREIAKQTELLNRSKNKLKVLKALLGVETKKKVGTNKLERERKKNAIERINIDIDEEEQNLETIKTEIGRLEDLRLQNQESRVGYFDVFSKKCLKKFGAVKRPSSVRISEEVDDEEDED